MITIFTQPGCDHCVMAKDYLEAINIPYIETNIRADADALSFMKAEGHTSVPQLYVGKNLLVAGGNAGLQEMSGAEIRSRIFDLT